MKTLRAALAQAHWLLPLLVVWVWFATVQATSFERIRTLRVVEPYALAVYNQLAFTFSQTGSFAQTIHFGYDDAWTWSGHRAAFLPLVSWIYGLSPGPVFLCRIQIFVVALTGLPIYLLGRQAIGGLAGGVLGLLVFALYPPLMVIALNDYQDVVLGVPFLVLAAWAARRKQLPLFALATALMCSAREEWVAFVPLFGMAVPGGIKERLGWMVRGGILAVLYGGALWLVGGTGREGHDNPMASHVGDLLTWPPPFTRTWVDAERFYLRFFEPVSWMGLLAPLSLLPALGPLFFHLTAPADGGVDTVFTDHIHHMAPVAACLLVATVDGFGLLARGLARLGRVGHALVWLTILAVAWVGVKNLGPWLTSFELRPQWTATAPAPDPNRPSWPTAEAWRLAALAPPTAPIATDVRASLTVSTRLTAYTYDESLRDKAPRTGMRGITHLLVRREHQAWVALAAAWPGATVLGEGREYTLYHLPPEGAAAFGEGPIFAAGAAPHQPGPGAP